MLFFTSNRYFLQLFHHVSRSLRSTRWPKLPCYTKNKNFLEPLLHLLTCVLLICCESRDIELDYKGKSTNKTAVYYPNSQFMNYLWQWKALGIFNAGESVPFSHFVPFYSLLKLVSWTWQWVHCTPVASTVTRSQFNRAPLGCGGMGDSLHGCAANKSAATVWCYHVNMDQNLWGMFPAPCWSMSWRIKAVLKEKGGPIQY